MKLIEDVIIPRNTGRAFALKKGQHIRVIGQSTVDFVAFNLDNLRERFDQARTKVNQGKIFLSKGDRLISRFNNTMFTIVEDTYEGTHDLQKGMCSGQVYQLLYQNKAYSRFQEDLEMEDDLPDHGCWENLSQALKPWNITLEDIPSPFNIFQTMEIDGITGKMDFSKVMPKPGTYVELQAEMNCLVGVSACPDITKGKDIRIQIYMRS